VSSHTEQYPFVVTDPASGSLSQMPMLPMVLSRGQITVATSGLLDTGSAINVLPYQIGVQLGAVWEAEHTVIRLAGNLAGADARAIAVTAKFGQFPPVLIAFAWVNSDNLPVILGQTNFFQEFDVCFFRSRSLFEIRLRP